MGSGAKWVVTGPRGVIFRSVRGGMGDGRNPYSHVQPALRAPKAVIFGVYPSPERSEADERGEALLEPSRIERWGARRAQHFDSSLVTEGWRTDFAGAYELPVRRWLRGDDDKMAVRPFSISFWWRPYSEANWTALDCGMERFRNRYAIFVTEGLEGPELVFRVCAAPVVSKGAEIYVPLERIDYRPGVWYHIQVSCRGEDPSMMELLVDGVSLGRRRTFTTLVSSLSEDGDEIVVESTDGFATTGALLVGDEAVSAMAFAVLAVRVARTTSTRSWGRAARGRPARRFGNSATPRPS